MHPTGIVRRIDNLGRVVIPKEARRTLRIREGEPLEILLDRGGEIVLQRYSPIRALNFATEYAEALFNTLHHPILICDRDEYVACSGLVENDYTGKRISTVIDGLLEEVATGWTSKLNEKASIISFTNDRNEAVQSYTLVPIIVDNTAIGAMIAFSKDSILSEIELTSLETAAYFLAIQMQG